MGEPLSNEKILFESMIEGGDVSIIHKDGLDGIWNLISADDYRASEAKMNIIEQMVTPGGDVVRVSGTYL